jgi:precorrin-2 dehydrogenase/sirohydrochlorin ferrochelatase
MVGAKTVLPAALLLEGRACLVVGAGAVAARKVLALLGAGAVVSVVAPTGSSEMQTLEREGRISWRRRPFETADLIGVALVITATGNKYVDTLVHDSAQRVGTWVNSADDPDNCDFYLTANVRRGPVSVAVSTGGLSPALASYLRRRLELELEPELSTLAEVLGAIRDELHSAGQSTEHLPWTNVVDDELVELAVRGDWTGVERRVRAVVVPVAP